MKKFASILMVLTTVASTMFSTAFADTTTSMQIDLDGKAIQFDVNPYVQQTTSGGVTLVEMRTLFEAMGLKVVWNADNPTQIEGQKDGLDIVLHFGSDVASVNGKEVTLAVAPQAINGHTMVPLRFIGEASGKNVKWNNNTNQVDITNSAVASNTTSGASGSTDSGSSTNTVTPPSYLGKDLPVYFNNTQLADKDWKVTSFYSSYSKQWYVHLADFFSAIGVTDQYLQTNKTQNGRDFTITYQGYEYQFNDNDGVYVGGNKISDLKFVDYSAAPIDIIAKALNFTYTIDENGVHFTK